MNICNPAKRITPDDYNEEYKSQVHVAHTRHIKSLFKQAQNKKRWIMRIIADTPLQVPALTKKLPAQLFHANPEGVSLKDETNKNRSEQFSPLSRE